MKRFLVDEMTFFYWRQTGSGNETTYNHFISWLLIDRNMAILHHLTLKFEFGICSLLPDNKNNVTCMFLGLFPSKEQLFNNLSFAQ